MNKINKLFKYILLYLSMLMPRNKKLLVFGSWFGEKFADNPKYLYLYCLKEGYNAIWITRSEEVYKELQSKNLPVRMADSISGIWCCLRAKYVFYCTSVKDVINWAVGNAVIVNLWHGVVLKKFFYDDVNSEYAKQKYHIGEFLEKIPYRKLIMLCTSDLQKKIFESAFRLPVERIKVWGQPRTDIFYANSKYSLKKKYESKKIILYMPTHRKAGTEKIECSKIFDFQALNDLCEKYNAIFLIKKHFYHKNEIEDCSNYPNIVDITTDVFDSQELLFDADILVSDYSSAYLDYLLLTRPIIFFNYDFEDYINNDRDMYLDYNDVTPGAKVHNYQQFSDELVKCLEHGNCEKNYHNVRDMFFDKSIQMPVAQKILNSLGIEKI